MRAVGTLQYGTGRPWYRRRRTVLRAIAIFPLLASAYFGFRYWPVAAAQLELLKCQRACLAFAMPARTPVRVTGATAKALLSAPGDYEASDYVEEEGTADHAGGGEVGDATPPASSAAAALAPRCWGELWNAERKLSALVDPPRNSGGGLFGMIPDATVFLHGRSNRAGERLVLVEVDFGEANQSELMWLQASVYKTASLFGRFSEIVAGPGHKPGGMSLQVDRLEDRTETLSLDAGQIDKADQSRLTIVYAVDGKSGTIEGRLMDDDTVRFTVIDGPLAGTRSNGGGR